MFLFHKHYLLILENLCYYATLVNVWKKINQKQQIETDYDEFLTVFKLYSLFHMCGTNSL